MSSKSDEASWDRIPTYEESQTQFHSPSAGTSSFAPSSFSAQLASARSARISALVSTHILPSIHRQVEAGLHRSTTVLVPSDSGAALDSGAEADDELITTASSTSKNSSSDPSATPIPAAVGSVQDLPPSDTHVSLLQLHGTPQGAAFWAQPGTAEALADALRERLREEGHAVEDSSAVRPVPSPAATSSQQPAAAAATSPTTRKKSFFRRALDSAGDRDDPGVGVLHRRDGGGGASGAAASNASSSSREQPPVRPGWVRVSVETREVAVRCCSAMGLYEARSGGAVVVRVDIGVVDLSSPAAKR